MDLEGDGSRELGLLWNRAGVSKGERVLGVVGARGSKLVDVEAGDRGRETGRPNGSDLLRPREPGIRLVSWRIRQRAEERFLRVGGGLRESMSSTGLDGSKLGFLEGGASSTLMDGGAIWDA